MSRKSILALALCLCITFSMVVTAHAEEAVPVITIARESNTYIEDLNTNLFTLAIEEKFGVDLQFQEYAAGEGETRFNIVASSGSELPDVINLYLNEATIYNYGSRGVFVPLNKYFERDDLTEYFRANVPEADQATMVNGSKSADGNIYGMPSLSTNFWNEAPFRVWINQAWLDALNLDMPTTTEEFAEVINAFITGDPNGNGINDEYGILGATDTVRNGAYFLLNAFLPVNPGKNCFYVEDGQIIPAFTQDAYKEGLAYIRDLCETGAFSPLTFTQDSSQHNAELNGAENIIGVVPSNSWRIWTDHSDEGNFAEYTLLMPLTGPEGVGYTPYNPTTPTSCWFITKDCDDPELAFRIADYMYDRAMSISARFGEYGVNWTFDEETTALYRGTYMNAGIPTSFAVMEDPWVKVQNKHWNAINPRYLGTGDAMGPGMQLITDENRDAMTWDEMHYVYYSPFITEEYITKIVYNAEELETLGAISTAIDSYVQESMVAFITGNRSLDHWDDYIVELNDMGLATYVELMQAAYDRR